MSNEQSELSPQDALFLSLLFEVDDNGICRHPEEAKLLAGFPKSMPVTTICRRLNKELITRGDDFLAAHSVIALQGLLSVLNSPTEPGAKVRLQAATELLDRAGVVKKERTETAQQAPNYVFLLPNKVAMTD